jgi:hypothetical protein
MRRASGWIGAATSARRLLRALGADPFHAPEIAAAAAGLMPDWGK